MSTPAGRQGQSVDPRGGRRKNCIIEWVVSLGG